MIEFIIIIVVFMVVGIIETRKIDNLEKPANDEFDEFRKIYLESVVIFIEEIIIDRKKEFTVEEMRKLEKEKEKIEEMIKI